jgi:hypothetical protein
MTKQDDTVKTADLPHPYAWATLSRRVLCPNLTPCTDCLAADPNAMSSWTWTEADDLPPVLDHILHAANLRTQEPA